MTCETTTSAKTTSAYNTQLLQYDVVVVGAGAAGLSAALSLVNTCNDNHISTPKILIVSKLHPLRSHTGCAEGGIAASLGNMENDSWQWHYYDTIKGSDYLADQDAVQILTQEANQTIIDLEHQGVAFSRTPDGHIAQRKFGGHTANHGEHPIRRVAYAADRIGHQILYTLWQQCTAHNITIADQWYVTDIAIRHDNPNLSTDEATVSNTGATVEGIVVYDTMKGELQAIQASHIVLATGGAGRLFQTTSNSSDLTGDGMGLALQAGLQVEDIEFMQFHPTGLAHTGILLSEAARGEGGTLRNKHLEQFMLSIAPTTGDLAPRDIVSRAIAQQVDEQLGVADTTMDTPATANENADVNDCVWLDLTTIDAHILEKRLPEVCATIRQYAHLEPTQDLIPVKPTAHYTMGGIPITVDGQVYTMHDGTKKIVNGLWAAGECSCVSVHGANRLGANSLLDAVVFGKRVGKSIAQMSTTTSDSPQHHTRLREVWQQRYYQWQQLLTHANDDTHDSNIYSITKQLQSILERHIAVRCNETSIQRARKLIDALQLRYENTRIHSNARTMNTELVALWECGNLILLAHAMLDAMQSRKESRGSLYRTDFPERNDEDFLAHSFVNANHAVQYKPVVINDIIPEQRKY